MSTLFSLPRVVPVNSAGQPYAAAKLYFYAAGTLVHQPVYTTSALTTAHSQPVVADSNGRFAAIYLDPEEDSEYRAQLYTSADVLLYDEDNIPKISDYIIANILTSLLDVDGADSLLDADLLDAYESSAFPRKAEDATVTGAWTFSGAIAGTAFRPDQGDVASAENITYSGTNQVWYITGTTAINTITDPGDGSPILYLLFSTSVTVNDATTSSGNIRLVGAADFAAVANDTLVLIWSKTDSEWREVSRSVNS